jgi:hypothetical protein
MNELKDLKTYLRECGQLFQSLNPDTLTPLENALSVELSFRLKQILPKNQSRATA